MKHAYLGWIDIEGLKGFQPETEAVDRFLNRLRHWDHTAIGIWTVLDSQTRDTIQCLLDAAEYQTALECLLSHADFFGRHR